jgi:hypothetical protein
VEIRNRSFDKDGNVVTREIAGETIIVPIRSNVGDLNSIFTLNEMGTAIWRRIAGQTRVTDLVEAICAEYDVEPEEAEHDTIAFLEELEQVGLIHVSEELEGRPLRS